MCRARVERRLLPTRLGDHGGIEKRSPARLQEGQGIIQFLQLHRKRVQAEARLLKSSAASWSLRLELLLKQAVLSKFIRGIYPLGGEIDAGSLRGAAVVIDANPTGAVGHGRREHRRGVIISDLRHTTTGSARCGTVRGQSEEEVISSATDIRIEKLRQSGAAGGGGVSGISGKLV